MTISAETIQAGPFNGNDSTDVFAITFKCFSQSDLNVVLTNSSGVESTKTITTHYTVSLNSNQDSSPGGSVTMVTPPATGEKITIINEPAFTQGVDLVNGGGFFPNVIEDAIDRNTILGKRARDTANRSVIIPVSDSTGTTTELPTETLRASKAVVFDSSGNVGVSVDDYVDQVATVAASATAAASSAAAASTSASASSTSASASSTSAAAAATSYDNFDDRWLGDKASDPSVDNDGDSLLDGAAYFNTTNNVLMVYDLGGTTWNRTTPTSSDQTKINTVSGIQANVTTVAGISSNVTTVAGISSDVTAVAADATDIGAVAAKATEIGRLGTADAVADMAILGTADVVTDMNTLGTADVVADMNTLGTADVVSDMNTLATADVVSDMNTLATADVVTDMNTLGTADVVADMNTLGTADVVADMNTLGTADVVNDMNVLGTSGNVTNMNTLSGISANITSVAGIAANVTTVADNVSSVTTTATNIADVNNFANVYRIASSDPATSLNTGDMVFNTTSNKTRVYNGSTWQDVSPTSANNVFGTVAVATQSDIVADNTAATLTFAGTGGTTITTNAGTDTLTIDTPAAGASAGFAVAMAIAL